MTNPLYDALFGVHSCNESVLIENHAAAGGLSYRAFVELAAQCANALSSAGLQAGDRLVVQVEKSVQTIALYAGCVQAGVVYLPLNTAYTADEVAYFLEDSEASLLICDPDSEAELMPIADGFGVSVLTQSADGLAGSFTERVVAAPSAFDTVDRKADDLAALLYTSGTTGRSKGAMLTQTNLLSNAQALVELWQFTEDDVLLHALPIFHTHGLFVACHVVFLSGARMLFEPKFVADRIIEHLPKATSLMGVPTFYTRLLADPRLDTERVSNMRLFVSGSAPLLAETHRQFEQRTGHRILERYGMTETNMNTSNPYTGDRRAGTVGFPLPGVDIIITDPASGEPLPDGEIGQLEVRGPNVFNGYWKMPEKTAEEIRPNGFFITGDLAQRDADGYITIVGRNKDLIISGGYNIYPKEIELLLDDQPGVLESAVIGVPHPDFGETVVATVVPESGDVNVDALNAAVSKSLARFKHPREIVVVESLPRNTMGKVQKNVLRDQYADLFV